MVSVVQLVSGLLADAATISLDARNSGYDKLHQFIENQRILPETHAGRLALIAALLLASRLTQQRLGELGLIANFLVEIGQDGIREEAKRILETADLPAGQRVILVSALRLPDRTKKSSFSDRIAEKIFPWMRKK